MWWTDLLMDSTVKRSRDGVYHKEKYGKVHLCLPRKRCVVSMCCCCTYNFLHGKHEFTVQYFYMKSHLILHLVSCFVYLRICGRNRTISLKGSIPQHFMKMSFQCTNVMCTRWIEFPWRKMNLEPNNVSKEFLPI